MTLLNKLHFKALMTKMTAYRPNQGSTKARLDFFGLGYPLVYMIPDQFASPSLLDIFSVVIAEE
jgi:hypothetical protein